MLLFGLALAEDPSTLAVLPAPGEARRAFLDGDRRGRRWFGLGMGFGLQGVSSFHLGVRLFGILNPIVTVSPIATVDLSLRANLLPSAWSPQIGAGIVFGYPYDLFGNVEGPECPFVHVDVGAEYQSKSAFVFTPGLSIADLDCDADTNYLPIPYAQLAWYFGRSRP